MAMPNPVPLHNRGGIPVIVGLVDAERGEHNRPAEARRSTGQLAERAAFNL